MSENIEIFILFQMLVIIAYCFELGLVTINQTDAV